jgi:uncharacterized protein YbcV (DUF1398 family)
MEDPVRPVVEACARESFAGTLRFGAVVGALMQAGVESYHADYRARRTTYYVPAGEPLVIPLKTPAIGLPQAFDAAALRAAIRGAQRGEVKYPEFLERSMSAGCVGYIVWIAGRHVAYFGRRGEVHVEPFPEAPAAP